MMRSGRRRSDNATSSRMLTDPSPSVFASRVCIRSTCGVCRRSSGVSSMVITRSSGGMNPERAPKRVVLPDPVPPDITSGQRACTAARRNCDIPSVSIPMRTRSSMPSMLDENVRTLSAGPSGAIGGTT